MSLLELELGAEDLHPIDLVETLAEHNEWDFDRIAEDQIAMAIEGQWRTYSLTLAWSGYDEMLRMVTSFEMDVPEDRLATLFDLLNRVNDGCWAGAFSYWPEQKLMVYRYGLILSGVHGAGSEQVSRMVAASIGAAERFYPAMQLAIWGDRSPADALQTAIAEAYGRA